MVRGSHSGRELIVEQTGGALADGTKLNVDDGGPYTSGTRYVLFLKAREDGTYYLVNSQGRYEARPSGCGRDIARALPR